MTTRVYVEQDFPMNGVKIHLSQKYGERVTIARFGDVVLQEVTDPAALDNEPQPLRLPENDARALYEALARYFGGAPDMHSLRKDYDAERARVDKFIAHLTNGDSRG